jgi:hypothetical protein
MKNQTSPKKLHELPAIGQSRFDLNTSKIKKRQAPDVVVALKHKKCGIH